MTILFLHGWHSTPGGLKPTYLKDHGHQVLNSALPDDDFDTAVRIAQAEFDRHHPDVVVGSSRGGAVAMNLKIDVLLVLLCPAWKRWGTARTVKPGTIILHSQADDMVPFADSQELLRNSGLPESALIAVGHEHRLADPESLGKMLEAVALGVGMKRHEITPIAGLKRWPIWNITFPYLKLALKYGLVGPWRSNFNRSVLFDAYSLCRGPDKGPPNSTDFLVTLLMASGVSKKDLERLETWLDDPRSQGCLKVLADALMACKGLHDMPVEAVGLLGEVTDSMIRDKKLKGIRGAKVFKWLSVWACSYVPMFDSALHCLFAGYEPNYGKNYYQPPSILLKDYQELLQCHFAQLEALGRQLANDLNAANDLTKLPGPISPVRILDSLLWFDYMLYKNTKFHDEWLYKRSISQQKRGHGVLDKGIAFLEGRGLSQEQIASLNPD